MPEHEGYSSFGASIFNVVYGIDVKDESDTYLRVAEDSLESLAEALILGKYWVDFLPFLKSIPAWFPGAEFQKVVQRFKPSVLAVKEAPYEAAHDAWVSSAGLAVCMWIPKTYFFFFQSRSMVCRRDPS